MTEEYLDLIGLSEQFQGCLHVNIQNIIQSSFIHPDKATYLRIDDNNILREHFSLLLFLSNNIFSTLKSVQRSELLSLEFNPNELYFFIDLKNVWTHLGDTMQSKKIFIFNDSQVYKVHSSGLSKTSLLMTNMLVYKGLKTNLLTEILRQNNEIVTALGISEDIMSSFVESCNQLVINTRKAQLPYEITWDTGSGNKNIFEVSENE